MQETDLISLSAGAQWLSSQLAERWTPAVLIERLLARGSPGVYVQLPAGWALHPEGGGGAARFARSHVFRVRDADDFLEQFAMFGDLSIAVGVSDQLVDEADGAGYRSAAPIPAAMLRLLPEDLRALAVAAGGKPPATFLRRVAGMRADAQEKPPNSTRGPGE